jgi:GxxExxY protein
MEYKYGEMTEKIIGAAIKVHNQLGNGFPECIYQRALELEFKTLNLEYSHEVSIPIFYNGVKIGKRRVDFLIGSVVCVELKAFNQLEPTHLNQAKNYLEAFNLEVGLLINFGANSLQWKRIYNNKYKNRHGIDGSNQVNL